MCMDIRDLLSLLINLTRRKLSGQTSAIDNDKFGMDRWHFSMHCGLNLTVVLTDYQYGNAENGFFSLVDGKIREDYPGLFGVMIDKVARRAGFEWRNSFGTYSPLYTNFFASRCYSL
jgi:hypothetical protein